MPEHCERLIELVFVPGVGEAADEQVVPVVVKAPDLRFTELVLLLDGLALLQEGFVVLLLFKAVISLSDNSFFADLGPCFHSSFR